MAKPAAVRFREAQERVQRDREDERWIDGLSKLPQPGTPVVTVERDSEGTRRLSFPYDADLVAAVKGCRDGRAFARWDSDARSWAVPRAIWACINIALVAAGYEIRERAA